MAEAFGVTASAIDTLHLAEKLVALGYEYIAGIKNTPDDLRQLLSELLSLSNILLMLQGHLQNPANPTNLNAVLGSWSGLMSGCTLDLKRLQLRMELKKGFRGKMTCLMWPLKKKETMKWISQLALYKSLFALNLMSDQPNLSKGVERHAPGTDLQSFPGEPSERMSLSVETSGFLQKTNLSVHSLQTNSKGQFTDIENQYKIKIEKGQDDILNWLFSGNFDAKHLEISGGRLKGTGKWLMKSLEFNNWIKGRPGYLLLWGYGIPGAGKTYLSSLVIDRLKSITASSANCGLAYIYFDYIEKNRQRLVDIMGSLIKQLSTQALSFPDEIRELYSNSQRERRRPNLEELYRVFLTICATFSRVFLVFDALDEWDQDDGRVYLLTLFQRLLGGHQIRIFLTSRPYSEDIQRYFNHAPKVEISAHQEDIGIYISKKVGENARAGRLIRQGKCENKIFFKLAECAKGTFLRVVFHLEHICQQITVNQILAELDEPNILGYEGLGALDSIYDRVMNIIHKKPESCRKLALTVLSWLVKARRSLTVEEVREAVSIELDANSLDAWDLPNQSILLDACAGLVAIDKKSRTIRLAHHTVQEYLLKNNILPTDANFKIAAACTSYLLFDDFNRETPLRTDGSGSHAFLGYARDYVFSHLRCCDHPLTALYFLKLFEKVNYRIIPDCGFHHWPLNMPLGAAIDTGLYTVARQLLEMGCDRSPLANYNLHKAVIDGSREMVKFLLESGAESSVWDDGGMAPLHLAVITGSIEIVRLFIQCGADISIQDGELGLTALHMAVSWGHIEIVSLLLENGAKFSIPDNEGQTAIHLAVLGFRKNPEILNLILQIGDGADIWVQDQSGCTALHLAAAHGFDQVIQLFIDNGIDFSRPVKSNSGSTPLHKAALRGHKSFVQFLVRAGSIDDISIQDNRGRTALHLASRGGQHEYLHPSSVQRYQSSTGYRDVVLALLENGADISVQDCDGLTAVDEAVSRGSLDILQLFLEEGADLSLFSDRGSAALYLAASLGNKETVDLLIERGVDIWKVSGDYRRTALHGAASGGHYEIVKLLLGGKPNPEISLQDTIGQTALHIATLGGHYEIARLLRERDINIELRTKYGQTAADIAASTGHTEIARLILENEVHHPSRVVTFHDTTVNTSRQDNFIRRAGVWATGNIQESQRQLPDSTIQPENQRIVPDEEIKRQTSSRARSNNKRTRMNETSAQMSHPEDMLKKPRSDTKRSFRDDFANRETSSKGSTHTKFSSFSRNADTRESDK